MDFDEVRAGAAGENFIEANVGGDGGGRAEDERLFWAFE